MEIERQMDNAEKLAWSFSRYGLENGLKEIIAEKKRDDEKEKMRNNFKKFNDDFEKYKLVNFQKFDKTEIEEKSQEYPKIAENVINELIGKYLQFPNNLELSFPPFDKAFPESKQN